jgi:hypothetical protein
MHLVLKGDYLLKWKLLEFLQGLRLMRQLLLSK